MVNEPTVEQLKVGELAEKTGKTVRALRLYEERGLLTPSTRSQGGFACTMKVSLTELC